MDEQKEINSATKLVREQEVMADAERQSNIIYRLIVDYNNNVVNYNSSSKSRILKEIKNTLLRFYEEGQKNA